MPRRDDRAGPEDAGVDSPRPAPTERNIAASTIEVVGSGTITGDHVVRVRRFSGKVSLNEPITCDFLADMSSLAAESELIEDFIKSSRFLDVRRYPEARFTTTKVTREGEGYRVEGRLSLHGVEKEIRFRRLWCKRRAAPGCGRTFAARHAFGLVLGGVWERLLRTTSR